VCGVGGIHPELINVQMDEKGNRTSFSIFSFLFICQMSAVPG
jgi:hypothetical protein